MCVGEWGSRGVGSRESGVGSRGSVELEVLQPPYLGTWQLLPDSSIPSSLRSLLCSSTITIMSRIPPTPRHELDAEQQKVHDHFAAFTSRAYGANGETFTYQDDRGAFIGGFPLYVQHPRIAFAHNQLAVAINRIAIPERVRNMVTLAVAGHFQAASEMSSQGKR